MKYLMDETSPVFLWVLMPMLIAGGAALVTAVLMHARAEAEISRQRETIAEARAMLAAQHRAMADRMRAVEEAVRRQALDEFMADIRVEQRQLVRENEMRRRSLVLQERVCFRNIPLTGWMEREIAGASGFASPQAVLEAPSDERNYLPANIIRAAITKRKPA